MPKPIHILGVNAIMRFIRRAAYRRQLVAAVEMECANTNQTLGGIAGPGRLPLACA